MAATFMSLRDQQVYARFGHPASVLRITRNSEDLHSHGVRFLHHKTWIAQTGAKKRDPFFNTNSDGLLWPSSCGMQFKHDIRVRQSKLGPHFFDPFLM